MKRKFEIFLWIYTFISIGFVFLLPETIPIHFNINWEPDSYGSRYFMILFSMFPIIMFYGMDLLKKVDPKRTSVEKKVKDYNNMKYIVCMFFILITVVYYWIIFSGGNNSAFIFNIMFGGFMILIGNYMPRLPESFFMGVRTPWTLSDKIVWEKTHRLSGFLFVLFGILFIVLGLIAEESLYVFLFVGLLFIVVLPYIYSYIIYKKQGGR